MFGSFTDDPEGTVIDRHVHLRHVHLAAWLRRKPAEEQPDNGLNGARG